MRTDLLDEIAAMAADNNGIITWAALRALGVSEGTITAWVRNGRLHRIRPRTYLWQPSSTDWSPMAAIQAQQPRAVASHTAAAMLHRFDGVEWYRMDVTVPRNVRLRGKNVHRTEDLVVPEIVIVDGIRCTDEVRTLVDYCAIVDDDHAERAMESVFRRDPSKRELLVDRATALSRPGKSGPARARRVEERLPEVRSESDLETVFWQTLRRFGVELPQRQVWIGRYRVDLAYPDVRLFIELDGYASRNNPESFRRDRHRQNDLVAEDWTPLRFVDSDVRYYGRRTAMRTHAELTRRRARLVAPTSTFSR